MAEIKNLSVRIYSQLVLKDISFLICKSEHYAITGPSGSGKSTLLRALSGTVNHSGQIDIAPAVRIVLVEQQHRFKSILKTNSFYYQQRYNASDAADAASVEEYLDDEIKLYKKGKEDGAVREIFGLLEVERLLEKRLIQLSNGENKRVQLAKALLTQPQILLLDDAFTGLDIEARRMLENLLKTIASNGVSIILVTTEKSIPVFVTKVIVLDTEGNAKFVTPDEGLKTAPRLSFSLDKELMARLTCQQSEENFEYAVQMKSVTVVYNGKEILKDINWQVKKGERWSLAGPNGAGKSTLLSLINADNPQAYANEIYLFGRRRGRGETIWDIKQKIGYVSPELHLYFETLTTAFNAVASGLFDTIGLFRALNEEQANKVFNWMQLLNIDQYSSQLLNNLPAGVQRLILLARALVKNPPLLLLDEPAQGLAEDQSMLFKTIVEEICNHTNTTLIYITHHMQELPSCISNFIELKDGKVARMYAAG